MTIKKWAGAFMALYISMSGRAKKYHEVTKPKGWWVMLSDHLRWLCREREFNHYYFSQGLDAKGADISDYLGRRTMDKYRKSYSGLVCGKQGGGKVDPCEILVKDKFYCSSILKCGGFAVPDTLFLITDGAIHPLSEAGSVAGLADGEYFLKNTMMESGSGVYRFSVSHGTILTGDGMPGDEVIKEMTRNGRWIIQPKLRSHPVISAVNDTALNTTRIFTLVTVNGIEYAGGYQAFATGDSVTDSWQHGSVYVSIDPPRNRLGRLGITSQSDPRKGLLCEHPDSKIVFAGYEIPFLEKSVDVCLRAHSLFEGALIIGWDIAITSDGPVILEANENPGINVLQSLEGGIRKRIRNSCRELKRRYYDQG